MRSWIDHSGEVVWDPSPSLVTRLIEGGQPFWLDIENPTDEIIDQLATGLGLHPLVVEGSKQFGQRPKLQVYRNGVMLVGFGLDEELHQPVEVHCYYTTGFLITLRRSPSPAVAALRRSGSVHPQPGSDPIRVLHPVISSLYTQFSALCLRLDQRLDALEQRVLREADDEDAAATSQTALPAAGIAHVGLAEVAYQRNELDTALRHVSEGIAACRQMNFTQPMATGLATLAWIRQAQGEVAAAARWVQQRGIGPDDEPGYPREPEYLVLARVLLAQYHPGPALALLERLYAVAVRQDRAGSVIEIQALQALALAAAGKGTAAVHALAGALTLASPQGYVRVFADEGPPMAALLGRLVAAQRAEQAAARGVPLGCLAPVLGAFGESPERRAPGAARPRWCRAWLSS